MLNIKCVYKNNYVTTDIPNSLISMTVTSRNISSLLVFQLCHPSTFNPSNKNNLMAERFITSIMERYNTSRHSLNPFILILQPLKIFSLACRQWFMGIYAGKRSLLVVLAINVDEYYLQQSPSKYKTFTLSSQTNNTMRFGTITFHIWV